MIIKIVTIPVFWVFNAMGTLVSGLAIKKGYATELARGRILTLALSYRNDHWVYYRKFDTVIMNILILQGPNLNLLGLKSSQIKKQLTLGKLNSLIRTEMKQYDIRLKFLQTHKEFSSN